MRVALSALAVVHSSVSYMDTKVEATLRKHDDPVHCDSSPDFDYEDSMARVRALRPDLDALVTPERFALDERIQDASFFAELALLSDAPSYEPALDTNVIETVLGLRFSCFGNLFTTYSTSQASKVASDKLQAIIAKAQEHGFIFIDGASLDEPYTGKNPDIKGTWWKRYFDYL